MVCLRDRVPLAIMLILAHLHDWRSLVVTYEDVQLAVIHWQSLLPFHLVALLVLVFIQLHLRFRVHYFILLLILLIALV